jgi:ubiquitin C-terminal hydrolase
MLCVNTVVCRYGGVTSKQKNCKCGHTYEREETFLTLGVDIRSNKNIDEALKAFIKEEVMKDENAVECEKCETIGKPKKVEAVMRDCFKKCPKTLVLQLKRFGFDWDRGEALKYNDNFEFPLDLDLEPYTANGLATREATREAAEVDAEAVAADGDCGAPAPETVAPSTPKGEQQETRYRLSGVVVHSGIANAGHYYSCVPPLPGLAATASSFVLFGGSFVKSIRMSKHKVSTRLHRYVRDPRGASATGSLADVKWLKFNDIEVELETMTESEFEHQLFGGEFVASTSVYG